MQDQIRVLQYAGEGLEISYKNDNWMVGVKNYKPASDVRYMECLERHLLTDELFVPLTEGNVIVSLPLEEGAQLCAQKMEVGCIYCVPQGLWHNVVMPEGAKIILIERPGTCADNSEFYQFSPEEQAELKLLAR